MKKLSFKLIAVVFTALSIVSCSDDDDNNGIVNQDPVMPEMFSINARGVATGEMVTDYELPGTDLTVSGNAFTMNMHHPVTDEVIGTVIDINVAAQTFEDGSMFGENYTVFQFNDAQESTLVLHNLIDMIPAPPAHMNAFIRRANTTNNVVAGNGLYAGFQGGATLIATLDMSNFSENTVGFNCMYGFSQRAF